MPNRNLYTIGEDLQALDDLLAECGGEVSDVVAEAAIDSWLAELGAERDKKLDNYCHLISEVTHRQNARQAESERLATLARTDANTVGRLKQRLLLFLMQQGVTRANTAHYALTVANNGGQQPLQIDLPPDNLPAEYQWTKVQVVADQAAIRAALDSGTDLEWARYTERGKHLRIR